MVTVICFFDEPARAIAEAYRVLAPGGVLVVGFLERGAPAIRACLHGDTGHRFLSQGRFFVSREVEALLWDAGFFIQSAESEQDFCVIVGEKTEETGGSEQLYPSLFTVISGITSGRTIPDCSGMKNCFTLMNCFKSLIFPQYEAILL